MNDSATVCHLRLSFTQLLNMKCSLAVKVFEAVSGWTTFYFIFSSTHCKQITHSYISYLYIATCFYILLVVWHAVLYCMCCCCGMVIYPSNLFLFLSFFSVYLSSLYGVQICRCLWVNVKLLQKNILSEHFSALSLPTYWLSVSFPASPFVLHAQHHFTILP